ncbi:hypothetical protein [Colwellia sp. Arc7-D]|uniref:hypothetical protein n=1 Tax=Colwellia sp. Arc7-D TaxID=2161872 RepID=UPI000D3453C7|nr:hypothetical protein [Colwellia sp. Arc7-D]AWB56859.1 hypothetical protein DBO93_04295 [Colwellia sp. Arc7-D]
MYVVKQEISITKSAFIAIAASATTVVSATESIQLSVSSYDHVIKSSDSNNTNPNKLVTLNSEWKFDLSTPSLTKVENNVNKSERLRESFNFGVKQWCAILGVARETRYKWLKKPETEMNQNTLDKLLVMEKMSEIMETDHLPFLSTLAFGRQKLDSVATELTSNDFSVDSVDEFYDQYYFKLEGLLKRSVA